MEISILSSSPSCMKPCLQQSDLRTQRQSRFPQPPDGYLLWVSFLLCYSTTKLLSICLYLIEVLQHGSELPARRTPVGGEVVEDQVLGQCTALHLCGPTSHHFWKCGYNRFCHLYSLALSPSPLVHHLHHHRPTLPSRAASAGWLLPSAFISFTPLSESISKDSEKGKVERNSFQIKTSSTDEEYQLRTGAVLTLSRIASISMTTNPINSSTSSWLLSGSFILSLT